MTDTLTFPGLGWELTMNRVAFSIGDFAVYWYGILFAVAFLAGISYFHLRAKKAGIHPYDGLDVILWAIVGGLIGARAYFVAFQWDMYKDNLMKIFAVREGGIAMYGGVIGAILVGGIVCRIKKLPLRPMMDAALPGLLLAQSIGRWGNFFNMEAFGTNTTLPWGMTSRTIQNYLTNMQATLAAQGVTVDPSLPVHPTFFYESVLDLAGFLVLAFLIAPRRKYDGQVALWYMAWYGFCRAMVEGLRTDSLMWGSFRVSQMLGIILFIVSTALLLFCRAKLKSDSRPGWLSLYAQTEESIQRIQRVEQEIREEKSRKGRKTGEVAQAEQPATEAAGEENPGKENSLDASSEELVGETSEAEPIAAEEEITGREEPAEDDTAKSPEEENAMPPAEQVPPEQDSTSAPETAQEVESTCDTAQEEGTPAEKKTDEENKPSAKE